MVTMETVDPEEMKIVFAALFDTCVQFLRSDVIIQHNAWFREHKDEFLEAGSSGDSENEALYRWMLDDDGDTAIIQFVQSLKDLACDSGNVNSVIRYGKHREEHEIKYLVSLLEGSLIKELSMSDMYTVLDIMMDKKILTKQVHKKAKESDSPQTCCHIMCEGILKTRGKSNWPFVFFEAISKIRPDLVQLNTEHTESDDQTSTMLSLSTANKSSSGIKPGSVMAASKDRDDLRHCLDEFSDFSDDFLNESVGAMIYLTEEESKSVYIQSWINSGNPDLSCINFYKDRIKLGCTDEDIRSQSEETAEIQLREYQKELAEAALQGNNSIICAPTGSGKTIVAVHIILTHLQGQSGEMLPRKVLFFARTVPLVMQQYGVLQKFLAPKFKVTSLTGEDGLQLDVVAPDVDVIVMTPRILENHLIKNGGEQLRMFSMLVFDECHHARGDEPYHMLMRYYLKIKQNIYNPRNTVEQISTKLPQIVGLTASIGVDNASNDDQAKENVLRICGNLDVEYIAYVEEHIEELKKKVHLSTEELLTISERVEDTAVLRILSKMTKLEEHMKQFADQLKHKDLKNLLRTIPINRKSFAYGNWVMKVKNIAKTLPRSEIRKMNQIKRLLIILGDYLSTYNVALELHNLVLLRHVMEYLQRNFDKFQENMSCTPEETDYFESFSELQEQIGNQLDSENPNLTLLKSCLMKYIVTKGEDSRGIIFVRTRALVRAVTSWLNHCGDWCIENLKAAPFTGTNASFALGGMTAAQQSEVIRMFKSGAVRLLVATSVAEEGIDIPECNLVIKYNYTGNEITTVQTRGRSRKKGGVSIILAMSKVIEKERWNQKRAEMMDRAVRHIRQMHPSEIHKKVLAQQQKILKDEKNNEILKKERNISKRKEHFKMVCHGCGKLIINSTDIRTVGQTHHVVVNWNIMNETQTVAGTSITCFDDITLVGPVLCKGIIEDDRCCRSKLGSLMIFSSIPFVVLGVEQFGFESAGLKKLDAYKKWKFVPYVIDEMTQEDLARYLPKVTASETNHNSSSSQTGKPFSITSQHNQRPSKGDNVGNPDKMRGNASSTGRFHPYSKNAQVHGTLSHQSLAVAERGRGALPGSATNTGAMCELGDIQIEPRVIGWTNLSTKFSSAGSHVTHDILPSPQYSKASTSDADSTLTLQSDCTQEMMSEAGANNFGQPSSVEGNREMEDMDTLTGDTVMTTTENTEARKSTSCVDVD